MSAGISENSSKKEGRGRPRVFDEGLEKVYRTECGSYASKRTAQNVHYYLRALTTLGFLSEPFPAHLRWLCDPAKQGIKGQSDRRGFRKSVLAELGRIEDVESMDAVAQQICEIQPKTRHAIAMIRRVRTGGAKPGDTLQLGNALIKVLNDYRQRHPATTDNQVREALINVLSLIEEIAEERKANNV
jgi:hypothetical protein